MTVVLDGAGAVSEDFAAVAGATLRDLHARVGLDAWFVARRNGDDYVVLTAYDVGGLGVTAGTVHAWESTYCSRMLTGTAPMVAPNVDLVPAYVAARDLSAVKARSYLSVPILAPDGELLGALCGMGAEPTTEDLAGQVSTVQVQAGLLGSLLSHRLQLAAAARRAERAESFAATDALTGAGNRRAWDEALHAEEARAARHAGSAAVVVIDLDGLKAINDTGGHAAGDQLLRRTAALLRGRLRDSDLLVRLGGDEFGVLLPDTDTYGARALADQLADSLRADQIPASLGVGVRRTGSGLAQAWRDADAAMYDAKSRQPVAARSVSLSTGTSARVATVVEPEVTSVDALLALARDQLGMDVAFLNTFDGDTRTFRNLQTGIDLPIAAGFTEPRAGSYCQAIVDGDLDEVIPDTSANALTARLPVTATLGIGSYVGVPLHHRDGQVYGTLCAYSTAPNPSLHDRDAGVLRSIGKMMMSLVEAEDGAIRTHHEIVTRLDALYADGGPAIVYQPILALDRLTHIGQEALSRFPAHTPDYWFTAAAAAGQGEELELRAISNALAPLDQLQGFLAVNVSPATIGSPAFCRQFDTVPLHRLVLELTEHEEIVDYDALTTLLRPLRQQGLRIAVDDAGAGFASMRHILALVPDLIKLDISLVRGIDTDPPRQALAAALSAFAFKTGAAVIAEGIETADELDTLRTLGIEYGQGYHLARPAPHAPAATVTTELRHPPS